MMSLSITGTVWAYSSVFGQVCLWPCDAGCVFGLVMPAWLRTRLRTGLRTGLRTPGCTSVEVFRLALDLSFQMESRQDPLITASRAGHPSSNPLINQTFTVLSSAFRGG